MLILPFVCQPTRFSVSENQIQHSWTQGPEEMCLSLEHQNPSKTSEKMGYFDRVEQFGYTFY